MRQKINEDKMLNAARFLSTLLALLSTLTLASNAYSQWPGEEKQKPNEEESASKEQQPKEGKSEHLLSRKTQTTRKVLRTNSKTALEQLGFSLIFSADMGLLTAAPATTLPTYFQPKTGLTFEGKALASILLKNFLIDGGTGWFFYNVKGQEPVISNGTFDKDLEGNIRLDTPSIRLSGALFEFSPSYRLGSSFFVGPTSQFRYPSDLGYDSTIPRNELGIYAGAQIGFQKFDADLNTRFLGKVMVPVNYKNWLGIFTTVGVQIGLPFTQPEHLTIHESSVTTSEKKIVEYKKQVFKFKVTRDLVKLVLDNLIVFYPEPGYPTITTESQSFLIDLSQSLSQSEDNWGTLQVDTVSREHAQVIRDSIVSAGVTDKKVRLGNVIPGNKRSPTPPVEFTFRGVQNQFKMMDAIRKAMQTLSVPETCQDGVCR